MIPPTATVQQLQGFQDLLSSVSLKRKVEVSVLGFVKGRVKSLLKLVYIFRLTFVEAGNKSL